MYFNQNYYPYGFSPINIPSRRTYFNPLTRKKIVPFKDLISKAERSVDTINYIIPLYKKVQPIISQGKNIITSVTSFFKKSNNTKKEEKQIEKVEAEIVDNSIDQNQTPKQEFNYRTNETTSKPFFV